MTDHEHTPPTEAELDLDDLESRARAKLHADPWDRPARDTLHLVREVRRLRAERSADSERLDWLETHGKHIWQNGAPGETIREAIDAARQEPTP